MARVHSQPQFITRAPDGGKLSGLAPANKEDYHKPYPSWPPLCFAFYYGKYLTKLQNLYCSQFRGRQNSLLSEVEPVRAR